eukprot:2679607-Lingulodinium_polyedra.AAC.1
MARAPKAAGGWRRLGRWGVTALCWKGRCSTPRPAWSGSCTGTAGRRTSASSSPQSSASSSTGSVGP